MCQLVVEPPRILQRLIQKNKNEKHLEPQTIQVRFGPKDHDMLLVQKTSIFSGIFTKEIQDSHWFSGIFIDFPKFST